MSAKTKVYRAIAVFGLLGMVGVCPVFGENLKTLSGHVPAGISKLQPVGELPATNELRLAIGLPLRDAPGLAKFLAEVYDPANSKYRHYLTPEQFTGRFGPTERDYAAVKAFARGNGFEIVGTHGNRLLLDVRAKVADINRAFHLNLRKFKHPSEAREFYAPDVEPTVAAALPVVDVSGLNNFKLPHPKLVKKNSTAGSVTAKTGSAPNGDYLGDDFRTAYVPDTTLTGVGQMVGLMQFDGFYARDVLAYAQKAGGGRTNIPIQTVLIDGYSGVPTTGSSSGNGEVALDIEMAMAMAPELQKIVVFSGGPNGLQNDILNVMAASNTVRNLSCSWGWSGGPSTTTDAIFQQMAAQGQSFFNASGDSDAFTTGVSSANAVDRASLFNAPSSSPYIIQVGGTTLTTSAGGAWQSETVWNWGSGTGSSGGISSAYTIPDWQTNVSMAANLGSTTQRNIPDVALTADNVYTYADNGSSYSVGGTSCAAPLWAGLTALANQQADNTGYPPVGFINPAVYAISNADYAQDFHDITSGDNTWSSSPSQFYAVSGYDLCTGWGTPAGQGLLNALVGQGSATPDELEIISPTQISASGAVGGLFSPTNIVITLTNSGDASLNWALLNTNAATWLKVSPAAGPLNSLTTTNLKVSFTPAATNLAVGSYSVILKISNLTSTAIHFVTVRLQVSPVLSVQPTTGFNATGPVGGPFFPAVQSYTILNLGGTSAVWTTTGATAWLKVNQSTGLVAAASQKNFTISLTDKANSLIAGAYKTTVTVKNKKGQTVQSLPFTLRIGQNIVSNGGFETGSFAGWTLNASSTQAGNRTGLVHSGKYAALLGQSSTLGYLSQTLPTSPGQTYLLSLWLRNASNAYGATPNEFQVQWEGATIFDQEDRPFTAWTNLQFTVTATTSGSLLQFGFEDDPYYLGLDDISVKPIATPHFRTVTRTPATFNLAFDTTPGNIYQVQCKTNLAQPDWIDLGPPVNSPTNVLKVTDSNVADSPQKFYRLMVVPQP